MNDEQNTETLEQDRGLLLINMTASVVVRAISVGFWCFIYIGLMWFLDDRTTLEKLIGFITLTLGIAVVLTPIKVIGNKIWLSVVVAFYIFGFALLAIV